MTTLINISGIPHNQIAFRIGPVSYCKDNYLYIGRGSIWGNPFKVGKDGTRSEVIELYRKHLWNSPRLIAYLKDGWLEGKALGCFCAPKACHGDVLIRASKYYTQK